MRRVCRILPPVVETAESTITEAASLDRDSWRGLARPAATERNDLGLVVAITAKP